MKASERQYCLNPGINTADDFLIDLCNVTTRCIHDYNVNSSHSSSSVSVEKIYDGKSILLARRFSPHNAGHMMIETAFPLEKLANIYKLPDVARRIVLFDDSCFDYYSIFWREGNSTQRRRLCDTYTKNLMSPLSSSPVQTYVDLLEFARSRSKRFLLLQDVIVEIGIFGPLNMKKS